jgi:hypothetical protein
VSVLTRTTRHHISEDGILYSHRRENLKSYNIEYISYVIFEDQVVCVLGRTLSYEGVYGMHLQCSFVLASPVERQAFGFSVE